MLQTPVDDLLALDAAAIAALPADMQQELLAIRDAATSLAKEEAEARQARVQALGVKLKGEFDRRVSDRATLETRWHSDMRRYNGVYESKVLEALTSRQYGSQMFVPLTRRVVNVVEARLGDLLFPTEDRNYAIDASPVPVLIDAEKLAAKLPPDAPVEGGMTAQDVQTSLREIREAAKKAAVAMEREVDDQLREADYGSVGRAVIHDGLVLGTGVLKGPMVLNRLKKMWKAEGGASVLEVTEDMSPTVVRVNPWDFYPESTARTMKESGSEYERHWLSKTDLAKLAKQPGFDADAIRMILTSKSVSQGDTNRSTLRGPSGFQGAKDDRYEIIEYHGPIDHEDLKAFAELIGESVPDEEDPLVVYEGVVYFDMSGIVIKAIINPMDTEDRPYSVWCWQYDSGSIFGFGLPHEVADMQETANSSFRAALDNLGLSVGPQIVVNSKLITPANGNMAIEPNKVWEAMDKTTDVRQAFSFFQIDSRISELLNVFNGAKALLDEIGGPQLAMQGQEQTLSRQTDYQASLAYNASNIWMRRSVRNWDDGITSPTIQRFVDWNMQHNPKPEIKGDVRVLARGASALLEAEGQVQRIGLFMERAKEIPLPFKRRVAQLREMAKAMRLDAIDILPDDAEVETMAEQIDNAPPPPNPEMERIRVREMDLADRQQDREMQLNLAQQAADLRVAEMASKEQLTAEQIRAKYDLDVQKLQSNLADSQAKREHDAQKFNAEIAIKQRQGSGI